MTWNFGQRAFSISTTKIINVVKNVLIGLVIFIGSGYLVESYRVANMHPRTVHKIWTTTPVLKPGGTLIVKIRADINQELCGGKVERWIFRVPLPGEENVSHTPVWASLDDTQKVAPGKDKEITVKIVLPTDLEPRSYGYQSKVHDRTCADPTRAFPATVPTSIYFTVVK